MQDFKTTSSVMKLYLKEREEILQHKWVLSERAGHDVGYGVALFSWIRHHRTKWLQSQVKNS